MIFIFLWKTRWQTIIMYAKLMIPRQLLRIKTNLRMINDDEHNICRSMDRPKEKQITCST